MLRNRSAILHIHDPELLLVAAIPAMFGARVVYDVHEFYIERISSSQWIPAALRRAAARLYDSAERLILPHFAGVVVVHHSMAPRYQRLVRNGNVSVVRNFPNLNAMELTAAKRAHHPLNGSPYAIHTGGAMRLRAFHTIVEAAENLPPAPVR